MFASKDTLFTRPSGYNISRSVRLRSSASAYLSRTPASNSNRTTNTISFWFKRGSLGTSQLVFDCGEVSTPVVTRVSFTSSDTIRIENLNSSRNIDLITSQVFRDPSAWYHFVVAFDTTQATSSNRAKLYVNGVQVTAFSTNSITIAQNGTLAFNSTSYPFNIGRNVNNADYTDGYLTEINFIDGQALTPSSFGETDTLTGVWKPKKYGGTYGTNGFYLNFSDNSNNTATTIGKDYSGNSNNWTPNNISVTSGVTYDSMTDVPTLTSATAANYAVLNPLWQGRTNAPTNGNLNYPASSVGIGTMDVSLFSSYWEITSTGGTTTTSVYSTAAATTVGVTTGLTYGFRFNSSTGALDYTTNGSSFTSLATGLTSGPYFVYVSTAAATTASFNGGQRPFAYTPPSGYVALNTYNLPASTISNGATVMAATTYTGTGTAQTISNAVNGVSFQPDFVWAKSRSAAESHRLEDSVRGATKALYSNLTNAETTEAQSITAFGASGFTLGTGTPNTSSATYVAWQWQAGQGTTSSNTNGSITSTVSVNATAGFSIVTYTGNGTSGATVGHGLGVTPSMIIGKNRSGALQNWQVWHQSMSDNVMRLNLTNAQVASTANSVFLVSSINSSVFALGTNASINGSGTTHVAYCWSAVSGFSAFGSYTGNGSADGPFVYTGFRPRFILFKSASGAYDWIIWDSARQQYNVMGPALNPNLSDAEGTPALNQVDILSNGFKIRNTGVATNTNGATIIYAAFAENPLKYALAR